MTEEGDKPTVSGKVQSTPMESLNDELTPKTDNSHQELESGNNIRHEIRGFKKLLTTSVQVIRLHWMPILISFIACFVFNSDIAEIPLNLFVLSLNAFAILLMFKLIKGEDKGKSIEATIHAKFTDISKLECCGKVFSQPTEIDGITWKTSLQKVKKSFAFYLEAEKKNAAEWWCLVIAEFRLISQESNEIVHKVEKKLIYDTNGGNCWIGSVQSKDLFDEEKGYVKDDSITVAVAFRAFPATIITLRSQFSEISKITDKDVYSEPTEFEGITWTISTRKIRSHLVVFNLNAEKNNAVEWSCPVIVDLYLVSQQKSDETVRINSVNGVYDAKKRFDFIGFIYIKDLFDEKKEYVKDDSIIVEAVITVLPTN